MALNKDEFEKLKTQLFQAKNNLPQEQYSKISTAIGQNVDKEGFFKSVYKGVASPVLNLIARPGQAVQAIAGKEPSTGRFLGVDITAPKTTRDIKKDVGRGLQTVSLGIPVGTIPRLIASGATYGAGSSLEEGNPLFSKDTAISSLIGAGTAGGVGIGTKVVGKGISIATQKLKKPLSEGVSTLLSRTSDTAKEAVQSAIENPKVFAQAQKEIVKLGNPGVLTKLQTGVRNLRTSLSDYYRVGEQKIIDSTPDIRVGLNDKSIKLFSTLSDRFGIDLPQNLKSFSSKELLDLNKEINELYGKKFVQEGAEGVIVRKGKDVIQDLVKNNFKEVGIDDFLKGYSNQKTVLDSMNTLFNAYKTKNPKAVSQAYRNIKSSFAEDKYAYLEAIQNFEQLTGVNVLNQLKAMQLQNFLPQQSGKFSFDEIFRLVLLPLTSPKLVGIEAKTLGKLLNAAQSTGEFIANLSGLIQKAQTGKINIEK